MKKLLSVMVIAALALMCSCAKTETETTAPKTTKPTVTTEAETSVTEADSTVTEPVTTQTAAATTKPAVTKKTKPTEPREKATEKPPQTTKPVPTQGKTKPHTRVAVTFPKGSFGSADLVFKKGSVTIKLNEKIKDVLKRFKSEPEETELSSERSQYEYDDFIITTYIDENDNERVCRIEVTENTIETAKGIRIGEYASRLRKVYGEPMERTKTAYYYGNDEKQLIFVYSGNKIEGIHYKYDV